MIIDVSRHQGYIDWNKVKNEGQVDYATIRCTLGSTGVDDRFKVNWLESGQAGIPKRGQYHYIITNTTAKGQFENIKRVTGEDFGNAKFVLDVERTNEERKAMLNGWLFPKINYTEMLVNLIGMLKEVVPQGLLIYTNKSEWQIMTTQPVWAKEFGLYVAAYPANPDDTTYKPAIPFPWTDWEMWQYCSTCRIPGINAKVDLSRARNIITPPPIDNNPLKEYRRIYNELLGLIEE